MYCRSTVLKIDELANLCCISLGSGKGMYPFVSFVQFVIDHTEVDITRYLSNKNS